jgi:predicted dienelactone hydrolase
MQALPALLDVATVRGARAGSTPAGVGGTPVDGWGRFEVGVRRWPAGEAPLPLSVWYPALRREHARTPLRYTYGISMIGSGTTIALASYPGRGIPGAPRDPAGGPYPVVVFSPGFALGTGSYAWLAEHLASHGFVVVAVQHSEALDPSGLWQATIDRPADVTAVLDFLQARSAPGRDFGGLVNLDWVAVLGHSYGGYTALAVAGARFDTAGLRAACQSGGRPGGELAFQCGALLPHLGDLAARAGLASVPHSGWTSRADPRVDAVVTMAGDAAMFGPDGLSELTVPLLAIGGTSDSDSPFAWGTALAYEHASSPRKAEVALVGAGHFVFAGGCSAPRSVLRVVPTAFCADPAQDPLLARRVVADATTDFLLIELRDQTLPASTAYAPREPPARVRYRSAGY